MSGDNNGKSKIPVQRLTVEQFVKKTSTFAGSANNDHIRCNVKRHCVHHETVLLDDAKKETAPMIGIPAMRTNHISWKRDEDTGRVSMKVFVPIYGKWPLGRNRGEDPRGDLLMDMVVGMHREYCEWLDANPAIKKKVYLASEQTCAMTAPAAEHVESPIYWEKIRPPHELAGEINPDKSPSFKVIVWDMEMKPDTETRPDDLIIDGGAKKVIANIVDDREHKALHVVTEPALREFTYEEGDYKKGKYPFQLFQQIKLLNPTVYFQSKKSGVFQFKGTNFWIREKIVSDSPNAITAEERAEMDREAEESAAYYGIQKRPVVEQQLREHTRDPELEDPRDSKKPRLSAEEMEFERNLREAEEQDF